MIELQYEQLEDRLHAVVPVTMIVAGVLHPVEHPQGLLYSRREIQASTEFWNGRPILLDHPPDFQMVDKASAVEQRIGSIWNSRYGHAALHAEAWLDVERCNRLDCRILQAIRNSELLEVSTGVRMNLHNRRGEFAGRSYEGVVSNLFPDHLAVLMDDEGACSVADGAGLGFRDAAPVDEVELSWRKQVPQIVEWLERDFAPSCVGG